MSVRREWASDRSASPSHRALLALAIRTTFARLALTDDQESLAPVVVPGCAAVNWQAVSSGERARDGQLAASFRC